MLTDTDLQSIISPDTSRKEPQGANKLGIQPYCEDSLTPVGYDLRVGERVACSDGSTLHNIREGDSVRIRPGTTALISTLESIEMPSDKSLSGLIASKVSVAAVGLSQVSTTIDADWRGKLLIVMNNFSNASIELKYGQPFCTAVFFKNNTPSTKPCGKDPGRSEIFLQQWGKASKRRMEKVFFVNYVITPLILIFFPTTGYAIFGNSSGFGASVGIGVALAQFLNSIMKR